MIAPERTSSRAEASLTPVWAALLLLLALVAIPFGANRPWAWSLMGLWAALLLAGWAVAVAVGRRSLVWRSALVVPVVSAGLSLGWILLSTVPGFGTPHPLWQLASEQLARALPGRITLSVDATLVALMRLLAYASIFWLALQYARDRRRAEQLLGWISWTGLFLALYGLINLFAGNSHLLWYDRWTGQDDLTSTFVNRNHYATFAGLGVICAAALGVATFRAAWRYSDRSQKTLSRTLECLAGRPIVCFLAALVMATAVLQTHSRMGAAATALAVAVLLVLMSASGMVRRYYALTIVLLAAGYFLIRVSGGTTLERIGDTSDISRLPLFDVIVEQISSAPYTGSGYGTFAQAFTMFRDLRLPGASIFLEAHNTYLELATEIGIPAAALLIFAVLWCVALCLVGVFRRRRDVIYPIVTVAASVLVGLHALVDFSLQIPAVAALYAAILGLGVAQSWSMEQDK